MPKLIRTNDNMYSKSCTGADFNRALGVLKDTMYVITADQESSGIVNTGFKYVKGTHELEVYVNGILKRSSVLIDSTSVGDYLELTNFSVSFNSGVITEGDLVRFRVTAANYKIANISGIGGIDPLAFAEMQADIYDIAAQLGGLSADLAAALLLVTKLAQLGKDSFGDEYDFVAPMTFGSISNGNVTPDLSDYKVWVTQNTSSTTITNFTGCVIGYERYVIINDSYTTLKNNANIKIMGGADLTLSQYDILHLIYDGSKWILISRYGAKRIDTYITTANWVLSSDKYYKDIDISVINKRYNALICIDESDSKEFSPEDIVHTDSSTIRLWMPVNTINARVVIIG